MAKSRTQKTKEKLSFVLSHYFATNQTSLHELKGLTGPFIDLVAQETNRHYTKACKKAINHAADDFQGIMCAMTICDGLTRNEASDDLRLLALEARAVIQTFFFDVRSLFDYLLAATLVVFRREVKLQTGPFAKKLKRQITRTNFAAFRKEIAEHKAEAISCFGRDLVKLWLGCTWFVKFNDWRNGLTHEGFFLAVNDNDRDLFRIETLHGVYPLQRRFVPAKFFGTEDAVSFSSFSGLYSGLMLQLLNEWSELIRVKGKLPVGKRAYGGRGGTVCERNIKQALKLL
jgi:hypothetical protein